MFIKYYLKNKRHPEGSHNFSL